jgi:hypothetical protein
MIIAGVIYDENLWIHKGVKYRPERGQTAYGNARYSARADFH